jgi:hypothetical protein
MKKLFQIIPIVLTILIVGCLDPDDNDNEDKIPTHDEMKQMVIDYFEEGGNPANLSEMKVPGWYINDSKVNNQTSYMHSRNGQWVRMEFEVIASYRISCPTVTDLPKEVENATGWVLKRELRTLSFTLNIHPRFDTDEYYFFERHKEYCRLDIYSYFTEILAEDEEYTYVHFSDFIGQELDPKFGTIGRYG